MTNDNFDRLEASDLEASRMAASLLLLCLLLHPCLPLDVYHLDPNPNTPKEMPVSPSMTIAADPRGKLLPPRFSVCASFNPSLRTQATGHTMS